MRVATITLNTYRNYGNVLQKYALYSTLKKFADDVEVLWLQNTVPFVPYTLESGQTFVGNMRDAAFKSVRQNKLREFDANNMRTRFDLPYLQEIADEYDFFVIGSDQVWNPEFKVRGRFLDFAPPEKRIAYAASIAIPQLPENVKETYRKKISEMPHVSLREKEGCDIVEELTGKRPLHVLDPVFLLTADEWREIAKKPFWLNQKRYERGYVLTYFFNGQPPQAVNVLAKKLGLPTINLLDINNFNHYIVGAEEFLYLIEHATLLCTHSFHGTSFASIFKRPFIVYKVGKLLTSRFARVGSLLELFDLNERVTDDKLNLKVDDPLEIDFTRREEVLPLERKKSLKFLANALWQ